MDPEFSLPALKNPALVEERLKAITAQLLAARSRGDEALVLGYARQAGLVSGPGPGPTNLFARTIHVYHPDRLAGLRDRIDRAFRSGDRTDLDALVRLLGYRAEGFFVDPIGFEGDWDDAWEDDPGFDDGEGGFTDPDWDPDEGTFLSAVRRAVFRTPGLYPGPADLARLTGELDLSAWDLHELDGIEHCRGLTGLNLAQNNLDNVFLLKDLVKLETLDLAENDLEDADALGGLVNLRDLDLSGNEIDDVAFLVRLPRLRYVDLTGNPVRNKAVVAALEARGVVVIW
jgi:hypothetical protein